jgi:hypothetical protein
MHMPNANGFWSVGEMDVALAWRARHLPLEDIAAYLFGASSHDSLAKLHRMYAVLDTVDAEILANPPEVAPSPFFVAVEPWRAAPKRSRREPFVASPPVVFQRVEDGGMPAFDQCHWPLGDPLKPGFRYCAAGDVVAGKPYCDAHCRIAYVNYSTRRAA